MIEDRPQLSITIVAGDRNKGSHREDHLALVKPTFNEDLQAVFHSHNEQGMDVVPLTSNSIQIRPTSHQRSRVEPKVLSIMETQN